MESASFVVRRAPRGRVQDATVESRRPMPQRKQPITEKPKVEDESTGTGTERHGLHRQNDEALPGSGGTKGGLNKNTSGGGEKQNEGLPRGDSSKSRGLRRDEQ
jgi:hypothetical protein